MKNKAILILLLVSQLAIGQNIIKDTLNVKKPAKGKLYFQEKDNNLYLYKKSFELVKTDEQSITPPPPTQQEVVLGHWSDVSKILVAKVVKGDYWLMQMATDGSYYVARGINLLNDSKTKISNTSFNTKLIKSGTSSMGGLYAPSNFPESDFLATGYYKNSQGEYIPNGTTPPDPIIPSDKIKIPVGLIMWDNWEHDYWNETTNMDKLLINHISRNRYAATVWGDKFNLVPFYGQHIAPEKIMIRYNVKWNQQLGRNTYDSVEKVVNVKFDKNQADTEREVKYYRDGGFDFLCFNYYGEGSYLAEARLDFLAMHNKLGMKMTIMVANNRTDKEIDQITTQMLQEYWFKIDNKPVLYMGDNDFKTDLPKYRAALKAKGGGDIYTVFYSHNGYPLDWSDYLKKGNNAIGAYFTTIGAYATQEQYIAKEVADRETWMGQYRPTQVQLIPTLSLGIENLDKRTDLIGDGKPVGIVESATVDQIDKKLFLMKDFIKKYPEKVPAILWYSANEIMEGGTSIVPKRRKDGSIDTTELDAISKHLD
jgi:hypothetical protein